MQIRNTVISPSSSPAIPPTKALKPPRTGILFTAFSAAASTPNSTDTNRNIRMNMTVFAAILKYGSIIPFITASFTEAEPSTILITIFRITEILPPSMLSDIPPKTDGTAFPIFLV